MGVHSQACPVEINLYETFMFIYMQKSINAYKVILSFLLSMIKHSQSTQSNKFAISLQYLKKEVRKEVHFLYADEHQSFYKLRLLFLMEVTKVPKKGSW